MDKRFWATPLLLVAIAGVYLVSLGEGFTLNSDFLQEFGVRGPLVLQGELYRLFTGMFLHLDVIHLAMNGFALYVFGSLVERLVGSPRFLLLYLTSGLVGAVFSAYFNNPLSASAGASGAIMGLLGYLFASKLVLGKLMPKALSQQLVFILVINVFWNVFNTSVDVWGHLGGFVGGFVALWIVGAPRLRFRRRSGLQRLVSGLTSLALLGLVFLLITAPAKPDSLAGYGKIQTVTARVSHSMKEIIPEPLGSLIIRQQATSKQEIPHPLGDYQLPVGDKDLSATENQVRRAYSVGLASEKGAVYPWIPQSYATLWSPEVAAAFFARYSQEQDFDRWEREGYWSMLENTIEEELHIQVYLYAYQFVADQTMLDSQYSTSEVRLTTSEGHNIEAREITSDKPFSDPSLHFGFNVIEFAAKDAAGNSYLSADTQWIRLILPRGDDVAYFHFDFADINEANR